MLTFCTPLPECSPAGSGKIAYLRVLAGSPTGRHAKRRIYVDMKICTAQHTFKQVQFYTCAMLQLCVPHILRKSVCAPWFTQLMAPIGTPTSPYIPAVPEV